MHAWGGLRTLAVIYDWILSGLLFIAPLEPWCKHAYSSFTPEILTNITAWEIVFCL